MIERSEALAAALVDRVRRMELMVDVSILDPDIVYGEAGGSGEAPWSQPGQLLDKELESGPRYSSLEHNRWLLDGETRIFPADVKTAEGEIGFVSDVLSDWACAFPGTVYIEQTFSKVSILQACSLFFPTAVMDGIPRDFRVVILMGDQEIYSRTYTDNTETQVLVEGFTVYDPTAIRVYFTRWSLPRRRARVLEIIPGLYERWDGRKLAAFDLTHKANVSCITIPYGTLNMTIDNQSRRFEPRNKDSIFQSLEERQGVVAHLGARLPSGKTEYVSLGTFYQYGDGWKTSDNGVTIQWSLVDIVGLVCDRTYIPPAALPTTLEGWVASVVAQLGTNFETRYHVDPDYAGLSVTANSAEDVTGKKCGDILRWACMSTGTWPRADAETGYLAAEPLWKQGNKLLLRNLTDYPVMKANESVAVLIFHLSDGTECVVSGNSTSSEKTITIENPFIHTREQAMAAARLILSCYGGNVIETTGRGDPTSEIGDVDTVWLNESHATTARRVSQSFQFQNGVLQGCRSELLQADGSFLFENRAALTGSGTWTVPEGVTEARLVLVGGGQGGGRGGDGFVHGSGWMPEQGVSAGEGDPGVDGHGGYIWSGVVNLNPGAVYSYSCGAGGAAGSVVGQAGSEGGHTVFGAYSTESGELYSPNFTDLASGSAYGRTGVSSPSNGTGDGGAGGAGGEAGQGYWRSFKYTPNGANPSVVNTGYEFVVTKEPGEGKPGKAGAAGAIVIYWDKPEAAEEGGGA